MKTKLVTIELTSCNYECPYKYEGEGLGGDYRKCKKENREIYGKDHQQDFPDWCPLKDKE